MAPDTTTGRDPPQRREARFAKRRCALHPGVFLPDSREDRRAKKISLTSEGMFFIQRLTLAQSMYLKEIWDYLTHDEQELFEVINKKLLAHFSDASS